MFCGKCGKTMKDDMTFCPYCGGAIESDKGNAPSDSVVPEPIPVKVESVFDKLDERDFYNSINVEDTSELPVISGEYLVMGSERILLSDIVDFECLKDGGKGTLSFIAKDGNRIEVSLKFLGYKGYSIGMKIYLSCIIVGIPLIIKSAKNEKMHENYIKQLLRILPLCGDDNLKKKLRIVTEIMSAKARSSNKGYKAVNWNDLSIFMEYIDDFETGEYPIYVDKYNFVTNIKAKNQVLGTRLLSEINESNNSTISLILQYYTNGRIDEFIAKEYKNDSGIIKYKFN